MDGQWILTINSAQTMSDGTKPSLPKPEDLSHSVPPVRKVKSHVLQSVRKAGQTMTSISPDVNQGNDVADLSSFLRIKEMVNVPESLNLSETEPIHPTSMIEVLTIQGKTMRIKKSPIENVKVKPLDPAELEDPIKSLHYYQPVPRSGVKVLSKNLQESLDAMFCETPQEKGKETEEDWSRSLFGTVEAVKPGSMGLEIYDPESKAYLYVEDPSMEKSDPDVITSGHESLYAHDYWQNESDSENEGEGVDDDANPNYAPGFDNDTSEDFVPFASKSKSKKKKKNSQESVTSNVAVLAGNTHLTDEQRFELGKHGGQSGGRLMRAATATKYSNLWGIPINDNMVRREYFKCQMLKEIYQQEPTLEMYLKHRGDGYAKLTEEQKSSLMEYYKLHGGTATAKHFSPKFKVVLNEAQIRGLAKIWNK